MWEGSRILADARESALCAHQTQLRVEVLKGSALYFRTFQVWQMNEVLQPFAGRYVYKVDLDRIDSAMRRCLNLEHKLADSSWCVKSGMGRYFVQSICPGLDASKVAFLDFVRCGDLRAQVSAELRFLLGAAGASLPGQGLDCGRFLPLLVADQQTLNSWLGERFSFITGLWATGPTLIGAEFQDPLGWVEKSEVDWAIARLENECSARGAFSSYVKKERKHGRRP